MRRAQPRAVASGGRTPRAAPLRPNGRDHPLRIARIFGGFPRPNFGARRRGEPRLLASDLLNGHAHASLSGTLDAICPTGRPSFSVMTYCVSMSLDAGMIFASDSRTN